MLNQQENSEIVILCLISIWESSGQRNIAANLTDIVPLISAFISHFLVLSVKRKPNNNLNWHNLNWLSNLNDFWAHSVVGYSR